MAHSDLICVIGMNISNINKDFGVFHVHAALTIKGRAKQNSVAV